MGVTKPSSNLWFWVLYPALVFVLKYSVRIIVVCALKMIDEIPIQNLITSLIDFFMKKTQHFVLGQDLSQIDGGPAIE